jgi:hypothetical protein
VVLTKKRKSDTSIELVIPASWYSVGLKNLLKSSDSIPYL